MKTSTRSGVRRSRSTWTRVAICNAFATMRGRDEGVRFLTCSYDEADGGLDPDSRRKYFRMLQATHDAAGRHHTIVITQSEVAQEMIPQRIVMSELAAKSREREAVA